MLHRNSKGMGGTVNSKIMLMAIGMAVLLITSMAAAGQAGRLKRNLEMEQAFKAGNPPADLRYYATGRGMGPEAVIGLDPKWQQTAKYWREIGPDPQEVREMVTRIRQFYNNDPRASDIVTPDGAVIGVYWSTLYSTRVKMGEGNTVQVFKPIVPTRG